MSQITMEKVVGLAKSRGFVYPGSEIYGGLSNSWDYGPLGVELLNNIKGLVEEICSGVQVQCRIGCRDIDESSGMGRIGTCRRFL